jgi:hypothetical protein
MTAQEFVVRRDHLATAAIRALPASPLAAEQIRLAIDRFAFTANNITYATTGDSLGYWGFYPADDGWGRVPVWGFATVAESRQPQVDVGETFWGYYPMATEVVLTPARVSQGGFVEGAAHRTALPDIYNRYARCRVDPWHVAGGEDLEALLRPLFATSWLLDDFLADNAFFGADTLLLSSASSKTAYGTAFQLAKRAGIEVVGLTSARHRGFCASLGCYHRVVGYDELHEIDSGSACAYVDFAGDAAVRASVHARFANLEYDCSVGATHLDDIGSSKGVPGPRPQFFFAPSQAGKRMEQWGAAVLTERLVGDWRAFRARVVQTPDPWLVVSHHFGPDAARAIYAQVLAGRGDPRVGYILSLRGGEETARVGR